VTDLIAVDRVGKRYQTSAGPVEALHDVSLGVGVGEFCTLIGPSGCGKSTLLGMIGGLVAPDAGRVLVDGRPVTGPDPRHVATVFQDPGLFPWRTTLENIEFGLELQGVARERRRGVATELLGPLGLREFGGRYPRELSGGMRQRAALARTLALEPRVLLLDEPFSALDELTRERLNGELLALAAETQMTLLVVTHSVQEAIFLSDRVIVLSASPGRVVADIRVELARPRSLATLDAALVGETAARIRAHLVDPVADGAAA